MSRNSSTVERQLEAAMQAAGGEAREEIRAALTGVRERHGTAERRLRAAARATSNPRATRHLRDALVRFRQSGRTGGGGHATAD